MYTLNEEFAAAPAGSVLAPSLEAELEAACGSSRAPTLASHQLAVERVIRMMWERYPDPLSLEDMARAAFFSRYHFNRMFRHLTGLPPGRFLAAIRLEAAKRMLLTTHFSVTAICFEVGYNSVGTFTSHFTRYVGIPPHRLRHVSREALGGVLAMARSRPPAEAQEPDRGAQLTFDVTAPEDSAGPIFVGLFSSAVPKCLPLACAVADGPGSVTLPAPAGGCYAFAVRLPVSGDPAASLLCEGVPRGRAGPFPSPRDPRAPRRVRLAMRPPTITDPPVLLALPFLLAERLGASHAAVAAPLVR